MDKYAGQPVITIHRDKITDADREKYNSFATRMPGPVVHEGRYWGLIGCAHSKGGHGDCAFGYGIGRDTSEEAMADARQLMYELRATGEE